MYIVEFNEALQLGQIIFFDSVVYFALNFPMLKLDFLFHGATFVINFTHCYDTSNRNVQIKSYG